MLSKDEQIELLMKTLRNNNIELLPVRDGFVSKTDHVYHHSADGPEYVQSAVSHWSNISLYPSIYSRTKPKFKLEYIYD